MLTRRELLASLSLAAPAGSRRPNIILILSDDQGYGDFSCHGNPHLKTPHLDQLAAGGVEFSRFYVHPVCAPTRAGLLTGRYHLRSGVHGVTTGRETMRTEELTLAESLRGAGYRTALIGKWHLGEHYPYVPHAQGFDEFVGFRTGHWTEYWDAALERNGKPVSTRGYIADVFTDEAIRFVEGNARRPFFLYLAYNTPHAPYLAPQKHWDHYRQLGLPEQVAAVYAMVANLDENIGRLLAAVDRQRLTEDTIVCFLTDNGPNGRRYNAGLRAAKGSVYEGGVRTPLFLRYGGRYGKGRKIDAIAGAIDLLPTLLDVAGVERGDGPPLDGRSLRPLLEERITQWPDRRMLFTWRGQRDQNVPYPGAVRTQRFNLINGKELYDIGVDPGETKNVAAAHPEVVAGLRAAYEAWFRKAADECGFRRPVIPVGHREENPVRLPAPQAVLSEGLEYAKGHGYAHEWVTRWTSAAQQVFWEIDVAVAGRYEVSLRYLCPAADVGARLRVRAGDAAVETRIQAATPMEPARHRDLIPRPEVPQMPWGTLRAGILPLPRGRTRLVVEALDKPGATVMELDSVWLRRTGR